MCPCGDFGIGLDLSMLVRPEVQPLFWTVVVMVGMFVLFLMAKGRGYEGRGDEGQGRRSKKHRQPEIGDIVQSMAEDNARLRRELERNKPRWRF